jgi:hypothetical protein
MAKAKRPHMKGKGPDVLVTAPTPTPGEEGETAAPERTAPAVDAPEKGKRGKREKRVMVTVYLPPDLVDKLDRAWVQRRLNDRKFQKSFLVAEALEAYLQE